MGRPKLTDDTDTNGLTTTEVATQLACSPSYVRKLQAKGYLPKVKDSSGVYRFNPHQVAEVARKLGRVVKTDGQTASKVYGYFLAPGFKPTRESIGRIVHETGEHPDTVLALLAKYNAGAGPSPKEANARGARELEMLDEEYEKQIAVLDAALVRKRRAAFADDDELFDEPLPHDDGGKPTRRDE